MWDWICTGILVLECLVLAWFVIGRIQKKRFHETVIFVGIVYVLNLSLFLVPYLYGLIEEQAQSNYLLDLLNCFMKPVKHFVGGFDTEDAVGFTQIVPVFTYTYLLGVVLAVMGTVSAAVEAFNNDILNNLRLGKRMKQPACDIVIGDTERAKIYARNSKNAVLLLGKETDKAAVSALEEEGFVVLRKSFCKELLNGGLFRCGTKYHVICLKQHSSAQCLTAFVAYKMQETVAKDITLYIEEDSDKEETLRREIIEKNGLEECITTFCADELLARTFTERHPATEMLPKHFLAEDASLRPDVGIHYFFVGFTGLSKHIYRQSILNNQLVCFRDGAYHTLPIQYHICDPQCDRNDWSILGLQRVMARLDNAREQFFPLPELPHRVEVLQRVPDTYDALEEVAAQVEQPDRYSYIIVDTGGGYRNLEAAARLGCMLNGGGNYHLFVRSDADYTHSSDRVTYYGSSDAVLNHSIIVNDGLSRMAKALNRVYTARQLSGEAEGEALEKMVEQKAEESWKKMNFFSIYSNIYAAMNLRVKLNLLGLDYVEDGKAENLQLLQEKYRKFTEKYSYEDYFQASRRNALLAQEHARWNAYHLLQEYLPMKKADIRVRDNDGTCVKFVTKNVPAKKHACLTTFRGLDDMGWYLARKAEALTGVEHHARAYDVYQYDELLLLSAPELLKELGYSLVEK